MLNLWIARKLYRECVEIENRLAEKFGVDVSMRRIEEHLSANGVSLDQLKEAVAFYGLA